MLRRWVPAPAAAAAARASHNPARPTDDFIEAEAPQIAGTDVGAVRAAAQQQERVRTVVDSRLKKKVRLAVKGLSFSDLCRRVSDQTGVNFQAARATADEKVTVFCEEQPLRTLMRQVSSLFGYKWGRSGEKGAYRYELFQDLRAQFAEEELRNRDLNEALLGVDAKMAEYKPLLPLAEEALRARLEALPDTDRTKPLVRNAAGRAFSGIQAYMHLSPADLQVLRAGGEVRFETGGSLPGEFPADWSARLLRSYQGFGGPRGEIRVASAAVILSLDHTELGEVALHCAVAGGGGSLDHSLAVGRSPSAADADNATANMALQAAPAFTRHFTFAPKGCPLPDFKKTFGIDFSQRQYVEDAIQNGVQPPTPHLSSADVWEEIHARTGMPILADYYTRVYPAQPFQIADRPLFQALCQSADALGVRWRKDGEFLQGRSTAFFWNKLKEVPNRLLDRWQRDREKLGELPLEDLLEMATLSDRQLDSVQVGQAVKHCRELMEWNILANPEWTGTHWKLDQVRPIARLLAMLPLRLREQALTPEGLPLSRLTPRQFEVLGQICHLDWVLPAIHETPETARLHVDYVPAGRYMWRVIYDSDADFQARRQSSVCVGDTPERALAAAQRFYPRARAEDIHRSYGMLAASVYGPSSPRVHFGGLRESFRGGK